MQFWYHVTANGAVTGIFFHTFRHHLCTFCALSYHGRRRRLRSIWSSNIDTVASISLLYSLFTCWNFYTDNVNDIQSDYANGILHWLAMKRVGAPPLSSETRKRRNLWFGCWPGEREREHILLVMLHHQTRSYLVLKYLIMNDTAVNSGTDDH